MNIPSWAVRALLTLAVLASPLAGRAEPSEPAATTAMQSGQYSAKGADTCLECHDTDNDTATFVTAGIFKNRHGHRGNARAPFGPGGLQCEACHGPGAKHSVKGDKKAINSLKADSTQSVSERNQACLACHQEGARNAWHAGAHDQNQVACTDCHKLHTERDAVQAKGTQPEVCFSCHLKQRADFLKASSHPVRAGRQSCSDCHSVHGSSTTAMLNKPTLNQTCFSCHAEKRGPLLWEHAPVAEDCSVCHTSHGSGQPALLTKSTTLLCQQCHTVAGHPSVARTGASLAGGTAGGSAFLLAGGCTNCHSQVHGSNHPAGSKLMR